MSNDRFAENGVDVAGPEDAPEVVFVHGTIFNRTMWAPQREALAEEFRVIAPDLPGHGARNDESFRLEAGVERVEEVVDAETDGSVHLVGLSLGGYVATAFASRHPEQVETLVLSGSSANPVGVLGMLSRISGKATKLVSRVGLAERATDWLAERYVRSRDLRRAQIEEIVDAGFDLRPFGEAGVEIAGKDFRGALSSYTGPVLILNGKGDPIMRMGEDEHAEAAQDGDVSVIDGAGHTVNLDRPSEYTSRIRGFVRRRAEATAAD